MLNRKRRGEHTDGPETEASGPYDDVYNNNKTSDNVDIVRQTREEHVTRKYSEFPLPYLHQKKTELQERLTKMKDENRKIVKALVDQYGANFAVMWKLTNDPRCEPFLEGQTKWYAEYSVVQQLLSDIVKVITEKEKIK